MKYLFIINPAAGRSDPTPRIRPQIEAAAKKLGADCEFYFSRKPGDVCRYVREVCAAAAGTGEQLRFYACGGDGTAGEAAAGLLKAPNAALGVVPLGSGNDFVRSFPGRDFLDMEAQMTGETARVDLLRCGESISLNVCNIGMDADVAAGINRYKKLPFVSGPLSYELSLIRTFFKKLGHHAVISLDGEEPIELDAVLTLLANGRFYGGGYQGAPLADLSDGLMDVCIVPKVSRLTMLRIIGSYKKGLHFEDERLKKQLIYRKAHHVQLVYPEPVTLCVDGECRTANRVTAELLPRALQLILPRYRSV